MEGDNCSNAYNPFKKYKVFNRKERLFIFPQLLINDVCLNVPRLYDTKNPNP